MLVISHLLLISIGSYVNYLNWYLPLAASYSQILWLFLLSPWMAIFLILHHCCEIVWSHRFPPVFSSLASTAHFLLSETNTSLLVYLFTAPTFALIMVSCTLKSLSLFCPSLKFDCFSVTKSKAIYWKSSLLREGIKPRQELFW